MERYGQVAALVLGMDLVRQFKGKTYSIPSILHRHRLIPYRRLILCIIIHLQFSQFGAPYTTSSEHMHNEGLAHYINHAAIEIDIYMHVRVSIGLSCRFPRTKIAHSCGGRIRVP
jgi:hypothetical protein